MYSRRENGYPPRPVEAFGTARETRITVFLFSDETRSTVTRDYLNAITSQNDNYILSASYELEKDRRLLLWDKYFRGLSSN